MAKRHPKSIDDKLRFAARLAVSGRLAAGQSPEQIRREAPTVAAEVIDEESSDPHEQERLLTVVQRAVEEALLQAG